MKGIKYFYESVKDKKIIIFGAGSFGINLVELLSLYNNVSCFIDNSKILINNIITINDCNYNVYSPDSLSDLLTSETVVVISSIIHEDIMYEQIKEQLELSKCSCFFMSNIKDIDYSVLEMYREELILNGVNLNEVRKLVFEKMHYCFGYRTKEKPFCFSRFMINVTTKCNLNCRNCLALVPLMKNPYHVPLDEVKNQIDILTNSIDEIIVFELIGGETFLYPYLAEALEYLLEKDNIVFIRLFTNCTIMPDDRLCKILSQNHKIRVTLSDYRLIDKMANLVALFEKNDVNFGIVNYENWVDFGGIEYRNRDAETLKKIYKNCRQISCAGRILHVNQYKLWLCPRSSRMSMLNTGIMFDSDYRDISEDMPAVLIREKIESLFSNEYASACNYCDQGLYPAKIIPPAIQTHGDLPRSEYIITKRPATKF